MWVSCITFNLFMNAVMQIVTEKQNVERWDNYYCIPLVLAWFLLTAAHFSVKTKYNDWNLYMYIHMYVNVYI